MAGLGMIQSDKAAYLELQRMPMFSSTYTKILSPAGPCRRMTTAMISSVFWVITRRKVA